MQFEKSKQIDKIFELERDFALLLTATIDIKAMPKAYPISVEDRQEDYFQALKYYVNNHPRIQKLIFVENSGASLDRVKEAVAQNPYNKQVEFISLTCNDFPRSMGKGYGEIMLISQGFSQSSLIKDVTHFAKITGRIYLLNLTQILENIPEPYDCLCDFKDHGWVIRKLWGEQQVGPHCDTRFIVFQKDLYEEYFKNLYKEHQEGVFYMETEI